MGLLRGAGNRLMDVAGPGAFALSNPLQRSWRDLCVGTRHNALSSHLSLELYGRAIAGHPSNIQLLPAIGPSPAWATPQYIITTQRRRRTMPVPSTRQMPKFLRTKTNL